MEILKYLLRCGHFNVRLFCIQSVVVNAHIWLRAYLLYINSTGAVTKT